MTMRLEFVQGPLAGQNRSFAQAEVVLGRDDDCEVPLADVKVSRRHARFRQDGAEIIIEDLASTNGVFLNGLRIGARVPVADGDRVTMGQSTIVVHLAATPAGPAPAEPARADATARGGAAGRKQPTGATAQLAAAAARPSPERGQGRSAFILVIILLALGGLGYLFWPMLQPAGSVSKDSMASMASTATGTVTAHADPLPPALPRSDAGTAAIPTTSTPDAVVPGTPAPAVPGTAAVPDSTAPADSATAAPPAVNEAVTYLWLDTKPSDAAVELDGKAVGRTPLFLPGQSEEPHFVRFTKDGYEPLSKRLEVPGTGDLQSFTLAALKGTCLVTTDPPGAAILNGSQVLGQTPCLLRDPLGTGAIDVRLVLPYYQPEVVVLKFETDRPTALQRVLKPAMGTLVLTVTPAGAQVTLDDFASGLALAAGAGNHQSQPLTFGGLKPGEHTIVLDYQGVTGDPQVVTVDVDKTVKAEAQLWLPDRELTLKNGKVLAGLVLHEAASAPLALITAPGAKPVEIRAAEVQSSRVIPPAEGARLRQAEKDERRKREMREKLEHMRQQDGVPAPGPTL